MRILVMLLTISLSLQAQERPNIIFIEADDLMPRFMNKLGDGFGITPNLDKLATQGVYFERAVSQGVMCSPSRNSLITNLYPHNLGHYRNGNIKMLPEGIWTFPTELQKAGYTTYYVGKSHILRQNKGQSKTQALESYGFDKVELTGERFAIWKSLQKGKDISDIAFIKHLKKRGKYQQFLEDNRFGKYDKMAHSTMDDDVDYLDGYTTKVASDWLIKQEKSEKPFYMWFNFCLPHGPYDVPTKYWETAKSITVPKPKTTTFGEKIPWPLLTDNAEMKPKDVDHERMGEVANVIFMDKMIGNLIDTLEATNQLENTVIVFFSDHSIFLGTHGRKHKGSLFEENVNPSLIISYPKAFKQNTISKMPVELLDLVPTVFDLAGIKKPEKVAKNGISLVKTLKKGKECARKYAFSEILNAQAVTSKSYRYITSEGVDLLYNLEKDPYEMNNVALKNKAVLSKMKQALADWKINSGPFKDPERMVIYKKKPENY